MDNIREKECNSASCSKAFDEKIKLIAEILPGGGCGGHGGCGMPSCEECAKAIAEGASVALCPACFADEVAAIAGIMGTEPVETVDEVAFIRCNGKAAGKERLAGCASCDAAKKKGFLPGECSYGCIGIGSCIDRCKFGAMSLEGGSVIIDKEKCNGCRACLDMCPQQLVIMVPREASNFVPCASQEGEEKTRKICGSGCIGCGDCEDACPEGAVKVVDNCAVIDYSKCVGCMACTVKCRKKIIVDEYHDLTKIKEAVAFVRCQGGKKPGSLFTDMGLTDCAEAAKIRGKYPDVCQAGCIGLGNCTAVCRFDAISLVDGTAYVDPEKCVGCLDCVHACPIGLIVETPYKGSKLIACASTASPEEKAKICSQGCIACGDCANNCPNGAISIQASCAVVDSNLCENCSICSYMCARAAISEQTVPESNYLQNKALGI